MRPSDLSPKERVLGLSLYISYKISGCRLSALIDLQVE